MAKQSGQQTKKQTRKRSTKAFQHGELSTSETKLCASCGRSFGYQKRWAKTWEQVRYCSSRCRQDKFEKHDAVLEEGILHLLRSAPHQQKLKLSQIETVIDPEKVNNKNFKERLRRAARRLVASGKIEILQKGRIVDASTAKGEIEVRLK